MNVDALAETITVPEVGRRFRCGQCGGKQINTRPAWHAASAAAAATITANVAEGELTPAEGSELVRLVEGTARAIEVHELAERIDRLEAQMASKGNP